MINIKSKREIDLLKEAGRLTYLTHKEVAKHINILNRNIPSKGYIRLMLVTEKQYNNSIMISSDIFLDFKLYNDGEKVDFDINWKDLTIVSKVKLRSYITNMYVYINMKYLNEQRITVNKMYDNRIVTNLKQKED